MEKKERKESGALTKQAARHLSESYEDTGKELEYYTDPSHFNSFSHELRRTMERKGLVAGENSDRERKRFLLEALKYSSRSRDSAARNLSNWFAGRSLPDKTNGIELCFALGLDDSEAEVFLRKACCVMPFHPRNGGDMIARWCLHAGRPCEEYRKMLGTYEGWIGREEKEPSSSTETLSEDYDAFLEKGICSPQSFMEEVILPHKDDFVNASGKAALLYRSLRLKLFEQYLQLHETEPQTEEDDEGEELTKALHRENTYSPRTRILKAVRELGETEEPFRTCIEKLRCGAAISPLWFKTIRPELKKRGIAAEDVAVRAFSADRLYEYITRAPKEGYEFRPHKESSLKTVMAAFPSPAEIGIADRRKRADCSRPAFRKLLILCYFRCYLNSWELNGYPSSCTLRRFRSELNMHLDLCHLPLLYEGDPFDSLILRAVAKSIEEDEYYFEDLIRDSFERSGEE